MLQCNSKLPTPNLYMCVSMYFEGNIISKCCKEEMSCIWHGHMITSGKK